MLVAKFHRWLWMCSRKWAVLVGHQIWSLNLNNSFSELKSTILSNPLMCLYDILEMLSKCSSLLSTFLINASGLVIEQMLSRSSFQIDEWNPFRFINPVVTRLWISWKMGSMYTPIVKEGTKLCASNPHTWPITMLFNHRTQTCRTIPNACSTFAF